MICYKRCIKKNIIVLDKTTENMIWIRLKREYLNTDKDFVIGGIYNSPINSSYTKRIETDIFSQIQDIITKYSHKNYGGDCNARVGKGEGGDTKR